MSFVFSMLLHLKQQNGSIIPFPLSILLSGLVGMQASVSTPEHHGLEQQPHSN